jgi:SAM-dependent methyltransferase
MRDMMIEAYEENGSTGAFSVIVNYFLQRVFGVRLARANNLYLNKSAKKVFSKCRLKESDEGFLFLDPMPSVNELNEYYSSVYWGSRNGKNHGVSARDLVHYNIIKKYIPQVLMKGNVFLNFGAGHGGISNLCWLDEMQIVNVEPSLLPDFYENRWKTYANISEVEDSTVDIIYGSHSLEHVQDIEEFKREVKRVLKPSGFLFWEVPNAEWPGNGAQKGRVDIPHTYYFKADFFNRWFSEILLCDGYDNSHQSNVIENWPEYTNGKGRVLRALGRID